MSGYGEAKYLRMCERSVIKGRGGLEQAWRIGEMEAPLSWPSLGGNTPRERGRLID